MLPNKLSRAGGGGWGWVAGSSGNKANSAQLELELGLSLAKIVAKLTNLSIFPSTRIQFLLPLLCSPLLNPLSPPHHLQLQPRLLPVLIQLLAQHILGSDR